jgi:DNA polymerase III delta subunit
MAGWMKPPPVMVISGSEGFLRRREVLKGVHAARKTGRTVERAFGEDHEAIGELIEGGMFGGPVLAIISKPAKIDADLVEAQSAGDGTVCLVLHHEGKIKKGSAFDKAIVSVPQKHRIVFDRPPQRYKVKDYAIKFVVREAKRFKLGISTDLAEALVSKVGTDLGVLHFELLKVEAYIASTKAGDTITPKSLMATMTRSGEADLAPLVEAVGRADARMVLREMDALKLNFVGDNTGRTLAACAWLGSAATKWLHAAALHEGGASVDESAQRLEMHAYVYKAFNLPIAKRWGKTRLLTLVKRLSRVEMGVRKGHVDPWVELECVLSGTCRSVAARG